MSVVYPNFVKQGDNMQLRFSNTAKHIDMSNIVGTTVMYKSGIGGGKTGVITEYNNEKFIIEGREVDIANVGIPIDFIKLHSSGGRKSKKISSKSKRGRNTRYHKKSK